MLNRFFGKQERGNNHDPDKKAIRDFPQKINYEPGYRIILSNPHGNCPTGTEGEILERLYGNVFSVRCTRCGRTGINVTLDDAA